MNRQVRTRMPGGVGGARLKPAPIPISVMRPASFGLESSSAGNRSIVHLFGRPEDVNNVTTKHVCIIEIE